MSPVVDSLLTRLPAGIRSRMIEDVNGLDMHVLESGFDQPERPCILLLHGFPELAYSWRSVMGILAAAGFYVVAPDQRGFGRTTGWSADYDGDLAPFHILNLVNDAVDLISALGRDEVAAVVGHDFGSPVAAYCALARPDIFGSVALMSAPFDGPPAPPATAVDGQEGRQRPSIDRELALLSPPRKHYQRYFASRSANLDMLQDHRGLPDFLRAYFHCKSGDWSGNAPSPLDRWSAEDLAKMPPYYVMNLGDTMPEAVAPFMPTASAVAECRWLPEEDLRFYAEEFERTGFQGGLQWYRCSFRAEQLVELSQFYRQQIGAPACFIAGDKDWGVFQRPGAYTTMQETTFTDMRSVHLVAGAGHWVQQERPEEVARLLLDFLAS